MERQLATIQRILEVKNHPNADKLDLIKVMGWQLVSKRDEFKIGDLCVFAEIDSVLPITNPNFAFLEKSKGRIKTIRLRGELSQGIAFPVSILSTQVEEGTDVTELLGITKYEPPEPSHKGQNFGSFGKSRGNFPSFIRKTDEIRLQSCLGVLDEIDGKECYVTMKLDGSSCTIYSKTDISGTRRLGVCSRNMEMDFNYENPSGRFCETVHKFKIGEKLTQYCEENNVDIAVQGELVSEGIQANRLGMTGSDIRIFNGYNIKEGRYLHCAEMLDLVKQLGILTVPILQIEGSYKKVIPIYTHKWLNNVEFYVFKYDKNIHTLDYWLNFADNQKYNFNTVGSREDYEHTAEGVVIRPIEECYSQRLKGRMSFKVISNKYLLEIGE